MQQAVVGGGWPAALHLAMSGGVAPRALSTTAGQAQHQRSAMRQQLRRFSEAQGGGSGGGGPGGRVARLLRL